MARVLDSDGREVRPGDTIYFAFGTPGVRVEAPVIEHDGRLIALTPECTPQECNLRALRRYVGEFWIISRLKPEPEVQQAARKG